MFWFGIALGIVGTLIVEHWRAVVDVAWNLIFWWRRR